MNGEQKIQRSALRAGFHTANTAASLRSKFNVECSLFDVDCCQKRSAAIKRLRV